MIGAVAAALLLGGTLPALTGGAVAGIALALLARDAEPVRPRRAGPRSPRRAEEIAVAPELLEAMGDPVLLVRERRVALANAAARALLGPHIAGEDIRLAIRHPVAAELLDRAGAAPADAELVGLGQHDRRWRMTVSRLPGGLRLVRLLDVSDRAAAERMRTDFVANASHELRTPLATLSGFVETLEDPAAGGNPATRARFLAIMGDEARRMRRLVDDLLSLSRIEADRFSVPDTPLPLAPLVAEAVADVARALEARGATAEVRVDQRAEVAGDRGQLVQALRNLLDNAIKYGPPGGAIEVTGRITDGHVAVAVRDRGEGIAPEHLPRLTERFYRVDPGRSRALGGTGLGLAIVKHVAERHRGRLLIESAPGEGTTVTLQLPRPLSRKSHGNFAGEPASPDDGSAGRRFGEFTE